jgi:hypothetical protein
VLTPKTKRPPQAAGTISRTMKPDDDRRGMKTVSMKTVLTPSVATFATTGPKTHGLSFQPERFDDGTVAVDVFVFDIIEQSATPAHEHQQTSTGMVVLLVNLEVFGQIGYAMGQQSDLHLGRSRVAFMQLELIDELLFFFR